ncbi:MAG TPA: leucine--tRNA ligase [Pirellulales bacterium]|jgi:leucyl-tRNA synthetase
MPRYNPATIEPKWQQYWREHRSFATPREPVGKKLYVLDMFPYPSGDGLHVGHPEGYTATDIVCRYNRMRGRSVLHPMGWDAFGLPAEQHAIRTGTPPRTTTEKNIATFRRQLQMLGFSYDWDRELSTTDTEYFRWTQWIFLQLFNSFFDTAQQRARPIEELPIPNDVTAEGEAAIRRYRDENRLAYQLEAPVNWCPALGTVLSNEEVKDGLSERGSHPVVRIPLRQWMLRITAYAERLERDLEPLDWSEGIKALQRNWIGRSVGAEIDFFVGATSHRDKFIFNEYPIWCAERKRKHFPRKPREDVLRIYTTRPDTLFGATYMVLAPEHPAVDRLTTPQQLAAVREYREQSTRKSDLDRTDLAKSKTGVFTGAYAINPVNAEPTPIWIADYVLMGYGTGAIMAVPAHDERDFEFARQFGLPIVPVVDPQGNEEIRNRVRAGVVCHAEEGVAINSGEYDGLKTVDFKQKIIAALAQKGFGREAVNYKLRDWLFSRQHFWGEPFPILHELDAQGNPTGALRGLTAKDLPLDLPVMTHFKPHGRPEPPLEEAPQEWLYPVIDGVRYKRETNTMPQWAGSCWYYLRFIDPTNKQALIDPALEKAWMPVDLYVGGAEHAVLHLLYARFWHKALFDLGVVTTREPFAKLVNQGMILGEVEVTGYQDAAGAWVSAANVTPGEAGKKPARKSDGAELTAVRVPPQQTQKLGDAFVLTAQPEIKLDSRAFKMSKSRGNVVNPDKVVAEYGADSLRLYEMFMGPLEAVKPWSMEGVNGVRNFLDRAWRMIVNERAETLILNPAVQDVPITPEQNRVLHRTIQGVTHDIEKMFFNTAISKMMEFTNFFLKEERRPRAAMETLALLLAPFAPHMAEELWQLLGHDKSLSNQAWPVFDEVAIKEDTIEIPVQINGKLRGRISVAAEADAAAMEAAARADERIAELLAGKTVVKVIVAAGRLVNFVVK